MPSQRGIRRFSTGMLSGSHMDYGYTSAGVKKELLNRLALLQASLVPHRPKPQLSPISHLPNELLLVIFSYGQGPPDSPTSLPFEIAVSGVCRAWRKVALASAALWTRVFITSKTPTNHMFFYGMRSANLPLYLDFCLWPTPKRGREYLSTEVFLDIILTEVREFMYRFRQFAVWDVSDTALLTILAGLVGVHAPNLEHVSVRGHPSVYPTYYSSGHWFHFPFFTSNATSMTHLEVTHFPIETLRYSLRPSAPGLVSLILRANEDISTSPTSLPAYLIGFEDLILLLRSAPNLAYLALYGPVIEFDDDAFIESSDSRVRLGALKTLIIRCREPGYRYHSDFLSAITAPTLVRLDIPWHDDLEDEPLDDDLTTKYLFDVPDQGLASGSSLSAKFASVRYLYLHDSAVKWQLPTRSFIRAFPNVEDVTLGGNDVWKFIATLRGFVRYDSHPAAVDGEVRRANFPEEGWAHVRRLTLKNFDLRRWKGCVRGLVRWLAAEQHHQLQHSQEGEKRRLLVVVRVEGRVSRIKARWFARHLDRLRGYAEIENGTFVSD